ncbi:MAG: host-nuclease inhibitor Gam family protein [bacterium]|nr:host-nuclease inhibitor Gam family protein [bacterium]
MAKKQMIVPVIPKTEKRADRLIQEIRAHQRAEAKVEQHYADATKEYKEELSLIQLGILRRFLGLFIYYRKNKRELTEDGKKKIANLLAGEIGTYSSSPKVKIKSGKTERVKELIRLMGVKFVKMFLREKITVTLDMKAMQKYSKELLANAAIAELVKTIQKEYFKVRPEGGESVSEEVEKLEKLI